MYFSCSSVFCSDLGSLFSSDICLHFEKVLIFLPGLILDWCILLLVLKLLRLIKNQIFPRKGVVFNMLILVFEHLCHVKIVLLQNL